MNENSLLCRFIHDNPADWETKLYKNHEIKIKREGHLAIFNYGYDCDFSNSLVQEARGIIINTDTLEVVCFPFRKFGNHNEDYRDEIDWQSARVLEKVDGSIIKLWYDRDGEGWQFSTNSTIRAENASISELPGFSFADIILRADNFENIPFSKLDKDSTYIFELVSPETKIVVDYGQASLYHIGTRSNTSGLEREEDIGIKKPRAFPISTLSECINAALALNSDSEKVDAEGFVVVDKNYHRIKVKSPDYLVQNKLTQTTSLTKSVCLEMILKKSKEIDTYCKASPALIPYFKYYEYKLSELCASADKLALFARGLFREFDKNRAALAGVIVKHRLSFIGFRAVECDDRGSDILMSLPLEKLAKYIPDYEAPDDIQKLVLETAEQNINN